MDNLEKNNYVKKEITGALLALLKEKDLNDITVSEITARAQVGRVSFYRNYASKEDILEQHLLLIVREWEKRHTAANAPMEQVLKSLFEHLNAYKDFYSLLYQKGLFYLFRRVLHQLIIKENDLSNPEAYAAAFVSYGIYGWIKEWLARQMQESPEEIYALLRSSSMPGKET